jgi:hypothetical protein
MPGMRRTWATLGGQLGMACIAIGILVIGLAWNGAASIDFVSGQVPYLLSGGALGLALVGTGVGLVVVQNARHDRALVETQLRELTAAVSRLATALGGGAGGNGHVAAETVLVGRGSYHLPGCRLVEGKDLATTTAQAAAAEGLTPCRICRPAGIEILDAADAS